MLTENEKLKIKLYGYGENHIHILEELLSRYNTTPHISPLYIYQHINHEVFPIVLLEEKDLSIGAWNGITYCYRHALDMGDPHLCIDYFLEMRHIVFGSYTQKGGIYRTEKHYNFEFPYPRLSYEAARTLKNAFALQYAVIEDSC